MHRVCLALALIGAVTAAGCGKSSTSTSGGNRGVADNTFRVIVQNGQPAGEPPVANPSLVIQHGYVATADGHINCGGASRTACEYDFPAGAPITLVAHPDATTPPADPYIVLNWAGDCSGIGTDCTLAGPADRYVAIKFGTAADRTAHPDWSASRTHGHEVAARNFTCTSCHGPNLGGQGIAVNCGSCHDSTLLAGAKAFNESDPAVKLEQCGLCHLAGEFSAPARHALTEQLGVKVSNPVATVSGSDVLVTFNVKVNGANRDDFLRKASVVRNHNEDAYWVYDGVQKAGVRTKLTLGNYTITANGAGNYTLTLTGLGTSAVAGTAYMLSIMSGTSGFGTTATAVAYLGARTHDVVSDQACINCHGQLIWRDAVHDVTYPQGTGPCIVCHNRTGSADPRLPGAGSGFMGIAHGIHNSKNMPDGVYTFTWTNGNKFNFSNGFPGNVPNCATCHSSTAELAAVANAPVSYALCISCHDSWDGFPETVVGGAQEGHRAYTATSNTDCAGCHDGTTAPATIAGFHDGIVTERAGLIWGGADQSVVLAPTVVYDITGVAVSGGNLVVTWTAKDTTNGNALWNPCNTNFANGPVFFGYTSPLNRTEGCTNTSGGCNSSLSILRAYALADDWTNEGITSATSPGQPRSNTINGSNTTCSANVATTTVALTAWDAGFTTPTKGIVAVQGKPQVKFAANGNIIWVRSQTPTREFNVADGGLPAAQRRVLVDIQKCIACHLGTVYQHGGTRVDKIELCVMCHDPSSSEQNNRVGMGVTAAEAYDGLPGQTYDLRYMVHSIHAAGENGRQLMFYRSNGIYFFGSKATLATLTNWPLNQAGNDCVNCYDVEDGWLDWCPVYGSSGTDAAITRNADGTCGTGAPTTQVWRPHRVVEVEYPRPLNDCSACHVDGSVDHFPDPLQAVAVTFDTGASPYNNLANDQLIGPSTAACMSCHQSGDATAQGNLRGHAYDFSWSPSTFPAGRQTLINFAVCGKATCP